MLALEAGMPNWDSMNLGMKVIKAVTMAHSAVYDKLTNRKVTLPRIFSAALGMSAGTTTRRSAWVSCQDRQGSIKFFYLSRANVASLCVPEAAVRMIWRPRVDPVTRQLCGQRT